MRVRIEAMRTERLKRENILRNVIARIVVAIRTLLLSMAFAIASGAKSEARIYISIVAVTIVSLFGWTGIPIMGPSSALTGVL
jgi:SulP family sulfate permease